MGISGVKNACSKSFSNKVPLELDRIVDGGHFTDFAATHIHAAAPPHKAHPRSHDFLIVEKSAAPEDAVDFKEGIRPT